MRSAVSGALRWPSVTRPDARSRSINSGDSVLRGTASSRVSNTSRICLIAYSDAPDFRSPRRYLVSVFPRLQSPRCSFVRDRRLYRHPSVRSRAAQSSLYALAAATDLPPSSKVSPSSRVHPNSLAVHYRGHRYSHLARQGAPLRLPLWLGLAA